MLSDLPRGHYGAILADPPWRFRTWSETNQTRKPPYRVLSNEEIHALPVDKLAAENCALFLWATWPLLKPALETIGSWGFTYKSAAFVWVKVNGSAQRDMFEEKVHLSMGLGYWTRANSEPCLLATKGNPKRMARDVQQIILEPRREHSRKPDCVRERIERLVYGPRLELFARSRRDGWDAWGNEVDRFP